MLAVEGHHQVGFKRRPQPGQEYCGNIRCGSASFLVYLKSPLCRSFRAHGEAVKRKIRHRQGLVPAGLFDYRGRSRDFPLRNHRSAIIYLGADLWNPAIAQSILKLRRMESREGKNWRMAVFDFSSIIFEALTESESLYLSER